MIKFASEHNFARYNFYGIQGLPSQNSNDYGIYDFKKGTFVPLNSDVTDRYDGLARVFDEYGTGRLFGDLDGDDCLTIIDVTLFQRCEAQICEYPDDELLDDYLYRHAGTYCFSDFNRDGNRDIVDATYIQRYLAAMI